MLQAGLLRHRVVLQKPAEIQNEDTGAVELAWNDIATLWADISPLSAKEFVAAQAEVSKITTRITIRYRKNITSEMRLYHAAKDVYYNIEGVLSDKLSGLEYLTLPCSSGVRFTDNSNAGVPPVNLEAPIITGNPQVGQTLTASAGLWANDPTSFTYKWYVNDVPVNGANSNTWVASGDVDDIVTVAVTASNRASNSFCGGVESFSDGVVIQ